MTIRGRNFLPPGYVRTFRLRPHIGRKVAHAQSALETRAEDNQARRYLLNLDSQYLSPLRTLPHAYKLDLVRECARELVDEDGYILEAVI